jgi:2-dehydro-3-deoxyphosphogluconate aldolase/(4S)-4-hydroxy-2-oxoglutarate aldolase
MTTVAHLLEHQLIVIIRGAALANIYNIANALFEGGIRTLEITMNSPNALEAISIVSQRMGDKMAVGAGTVLDASTTKMAVDAGAKFIISPITSFETIQVAKQLGVVSIPGAYTPTEIYNAWRAGGDIIKVFPASAGPTFVREVLAPLSHLPLMPTGGVSLQNIAEFKKAGAVAFGLGKALVDTSQEVTDEYLQQLITKAESFVRAVSD